MEVVSCLYLIEEFHFRVERRIVCVWSPNPLKGFSCKLIFWPLLDPSPIIDPVFDVLRIKVPIKLKFFTWKVLLDRVNIMN